MDVRVLGPLEVRRGGMVVPVTAPKLRTLLLLLVMDVGRAVSADHLVDALWGQDTPPQPLASLRSYISNLRRLLQEPEAGSPIVTNGRGYVLGVEPDRVDAYRFERLVGEGRQALAGGDPDRAVRTFDLALGLWRGEAFADIAHEPFAAPLVAKFEELRRTASEERFDALLVGGRHVEAVPELERHAAAHPLRERPRRQLMLALYRAGRAVDALQVHATFRSSLIDEAGLDPGPEIDELYDSILRQEASLDPPERRPAPPERDDGQRSDVGSATGPIPSPPPRRTIVGRELERGRLKAALDAMSRGEGGVVLIAGEPGIGKTALLQELSSLAAASGVSSVWGRCIGPTDAPAFWPWIEVLRAATADLDADDFRLTLVGAAASVVHLLPELADRAGVSPVPLAHEPQAARFALFDAVAVFLTRLTDGPSAPRPSGLVVVLDDLHWADPTTLQLVEFLATRGSLGRVLLSGSYRDSPSDRSVELERALAAASRRASTTAIELRPLAASEVAAIVTDVTGIPPEADRLAQLTRRSGGNPFFARQLAVLGAESSSTSRRSLVPTGVRHVLLQRIELLPREVRATLDVAATIGQEFDARVVAAALGREIVEVLADVDVAIRHGLVDVGDHTSSAYRFVHALVRETLEAEIPPGRAAGLHAAVADGLEHVGVSSAAELAGHLWQAAEVLPATRIVPHLRAAAEDDIAVTAYEPAEQHLRRVLHLLSHPDAHDPATELAVRLRLVQILTRTKGWPDSDIDVMAGRVRHLAGRIEVTPELVGLWWSLWTAAITRGQLATAAELSQHLLALTEGAEGDPVGPLAANLAYAYTELFRGAPRERIERHIEVARRAIGGVDPEALALTPEHLAVSLHVAEVVTAGIFDDEPATLEAIEELLAAARTTGAALGGAHAHMIAAWAAAAIDRPDLALIRAETALALSDDAGLAFLARLTAPLHAWAAARSGQDPHAQTARMTEALAFLTNTGHLHALPHWHALHAEMYLLAGDPVAAAASYTRAHRVGEATGELVYGRQWSRIEQRLERARAT